MPFYENVFIARQEISAAQVDALADQVVAIVGENGGTLKKKEYWGLKGLAFRIKKNRKGHYVLLNLDAPPAAIHEMERQMRINEDIVRFLTVRVDALEEGPSAMLQARGRDDRPRRFDDRPRRYDDRPGGRFDDRPGGRFDDRPGGRFGDRPGGRGEPRGEPRGEAPTGAASEAGGEAAGTATEGES
jgi:small subunit ribosomal protein S6